MLNIKPDVPGARLGINSAGALAKTAELWEVSTALVPSLPINERPTCDPEEYQLVDQLRATSRASPEAAWPTELPWKSKNTDPMAVSMLFWLPTSLIPAWNVGADPVKVPPPENDNARVSLVMT